MSNCVNMTEQRHGAREVLQGRKVDVLEMKYLRSLFGVSRMDKVGNEDVRWRAEIERELAREH